jgi:hypothetical protein
MAQIQKGFEYDSSNPAKNVVTDDNLNSLVANATLLNGAITEQTANSVSTDTDIMLLSKAGSLIKQTKGEFTNTINSNTVNVNTVNASLVDTDDIDTVTASLTGDLAVGGNAAITGNLAVTGGVTVTGMVTASTAPTAGGNLTNKTYVDGTVSKTTNGHVKLPNGLIMQWGVGSSMVGFGIQTITFPIVFPTACLNVQVCQRIPTAVGSGATAENSIQVNGTPTTTSFGVFSNSTGSQNFTSFLPVWFAIGY